MSILCVGPAFAPVAVAVAMAKAVAKPLNVLGSVPTLPPLSFWEIHTSTVCNFYETCCDTCIPHFLALNLKWDASRSLKETCGIRQIFV